MAQERDSQRDSQRDFPSTNSRARLLRATSAIAVGVAGLAGTGAMPAAAQDKAVEMIVVTGSNVRQKKDFQTPSPVQTIGETEIKNTGAVRLQDVFKGLTVNSGSQTSNRQNALQGISQFSLRGLGIGSTLTLVNGRRAGLAPVTDDTGQLFTDSNQFPVNMIERIEVLTDGASATYGSEAVAGVVNIITRSNFDGLELTGEFRTSTHESYQIGGAFGHTFDRGSFAVFANYYSQGGNFRGDFDFISDRDADSPNGIGAIFSSGTGSPGRYQRAVPDGIGGFERTGNTLADPDCEAAQGFLDDEGDNCRYPFIDQRRLIAEEDRFQSFAEFSYDISERVTFVSEVSFSRNEIRDALGGAVLRLTTQDGGFLIPSDHPFNFFVADGAEGITYAGPEAFAADPSLTAVDVITRSRPLGRAFDGPNAEDITTTFTNVRFAGGFDVELSDNWFVNVNYMNAQNEVTRSQPRDYDFNLYQQAIADGVWNPFGTAIATPGLVSPKDGVSDAVNSAEDLGLFALTINNYAKVTQEVAELTVSGDTGIGLPGGTVAVAIGGQYRDLTFEDIPDSRRQNGTNGRGEVEGITTGQQDAYAVFAEAIVPILDTLEMQFAVRYEDYGDQGGDTLDPKIAVKYDVLDELALRGSWGTSFQAPSIRQVAGSVGNAGVTDPLNPLAGSFNVTVFTQGSEDLTSQSAENFNVGLVYSADWGLDFSFDFWSYDYDDLILPGGSAQSIVDEVAAGTLPASRVLRDPSGQLNAVFTGFLNRGSAKAQGFDIAAVYRPEILDWGSLTFDASATIITKFTSTEFAGLDGNGDLKGSRNFANGFGSTPDVKINGGITLDTARHTGNISVRYIGSYTDDQTLLPIDSQITVDLRYALSLEGLLGTEGSVFSVGAVNIFDTDPPAIEERPLFDTEVHDPRGRQIYVSFAQRF